MDRTLEHWTAPGTHLESWSRSDILPDVMARMRAVLSSLAARGYADMPENPGYALTIRPTWTGTQYVTLYELHYTGEGVMTIGIGTTDAVATWQALMGTVLPAPHGLWCVTRLDPGAATAAIVLPANAVDQWNGLARCLAWAVLDP